MSYQTILTQTGLTKQAAAMAGGTAVKIAEIAIGDAGGMGYTPIGSETALVGEVWRTTLFDTTPPGSAPGALRLEAILPANVGGWTMRELGLFDADGDLIAIGALPGWEKPTGTEALSDMMLRINLQVSDSTAFQIVVDPSAYVTHSTVESAVAQSKAEPLLEVGQSLESKASTSALSDAVANLNQAIQSQKTDLEALIGSKADSISVSQSLSNLNQAIGEKASTSTLDQAIQDVLKDAASYAAVVAATSWRPASTSASVNSINAICLGATMASTPIWVLGGGNGRLEWSYHTFWSEVSPSPFGTSHIFGIAYGNGIFVAVGASGKIATSEDGRNWTIRSSGTSSGINGVIFANGTFIAWYGSSVLISTDGVTWSSYNTGLTEGIQSIAFGSGRLLAIGGMTKAVASIDGGISWGTPYEIPDLWMVTDIAYGAGKFAVCSMNGYIHTSIDGVVWEYQQNIHQDMINSFSKVEFSNGVFVAVGDNSGIVSRDGITWHMAEGFDSIQGNALGYGMGFWLCGGSDGKMLRSLGG